MTAQRDQNRIPVAQGISNSDGTTMISIYANPSTKAIKVSDGTTGVDYGPIDDKRDENRVVAFMAVSAVDGITPVPIYADQSTNFLLIKST